MHTSARGRVRRPVHPFRTVLEQKIKEERRLTLQEFVEFAEAFARKHGEPGTISLRRLNSLIAGHRDNGAPLGLRLVTARLLERIFGLSIDELLAPPRDDEEVESSCSDVDVKQDRNDLSANRPVVAFEWLDKRAGWTPDTARRRVAAQAKKLEMADLLDRQIRRARVSRSQIARALSDYYREKVPGYGPYGVRYDGRSLSTSLLVRPSWLDLECPLGGGHDRSELASVESGYRHDLDTFGARQAVSRLAEAVALDVRVSDAPIYRLLSIDAARGEISGAFGMAPFVEYALTMDLLEDELIDAVIGTGEARHGTVPLRDRYLPDLESVLGVSGRLCGGGALALCAIARPADPYRGDADYTLLVQERSDNVLNAARRLSVIPKAFHEPLNDDRADVPIRSTLLREMEEELFGRSEVDGTIGGRRVADPMHPTRLSEPMSWLMGQPERLRIECTGFGLNMVSGNFEFASLIVIDDEEFWARYGGHIEANWESSGLHVYSSLDRELTGKLISDESWSNEGLFALLQGFRRLSEIGAQRVNLPAIMPEIG